MEKLDKKNKQILIECVQGGAKNIEFLKRKSSNKINLYKVLADDRTFTRNKIQNRLRREKIKFTERKTSLSSEPITEFVHETTLIRILYKPVRGGMTETTLNSTITELVPCLMFHNNISTNNISKIQEKLYKLNHNTQKCYVSSDDVKAGKDFVEKFETSSKYTEKMKNAIAIYNFLCETHKTKPIKIVYWTYRKKPNGIPSNSPADIVICFKDNQLLGVSLKAGTTTSKEPLLNTYMNPIFDNLAPSKRNELRKKLYTKVYSQIENIPTFDNYDSKLRTETLNTLDDLEQMNEELYNKLYDESLEIIRQNLMQLLVENKQKFISYVKYAILKESDVPVILIKASGTSFEEKKDSNKLKNMLTRVTDIEARITTSSKQNFCILLKSKNKLLGTMNWSVRSNKVGINHKLGQFFNMAVKYNGLS
jgi:hypothetical protein